MKKIKSIVILCVSGFMIAQSATSLGAPSCGPIIDSNIQAQLKIGNYTSEQRLKALATKFRELCGNSTDLVGSKQFSAESTGYNEVTTLCTSSTGGRKVIVVNIEGGVAFWKSDSSQCANAIPSSEELSIIQQYY